MEWLQQEMESFLLLLHVKSKNFLFQYVLEMELFLLLFTSDQKTFFYKMFLTFTNKFKTSFENMKWNFFYNF